MSGKLIGDDIGEQATVRVDAIRSSSRFFFWVIPLCTANSDRALGVMKKAQQTGLHPIAQKEDDGENQALRARHTKSNQRGYPQTRANIKLAKSKRLYPTKGDIQPDIVMQPPPPSSTSLLR